MALMIRDRRPHDVDRCVSVLADVYAKDRYPHLWPDDPAAWLTREDTHNAWIAEIDGVLVGHVCTARSGEIRRLFVAPSARRQQVAARLLGVAASSVRARGMTPSLQVLAGDESILVYERLGWRRTSTSELTFDDGSVHTVYGYEAS